MRVATLLALLVMAPPALAATVRPPEEKQTVVDLAYTLGEAHALRAACRGSEDQAWRSRMTRVLEVEQPDEGYRRRLVEAFNAGFVSRQAEHPGCNAETPVAERAAAARGRDLAQRLASLSR